MITNRWLRASDQDRESAVESVSEARAAGLLSSEEFDERTIAAYSAKTLGELRDLTADLPIPATRSGLPSDIVGLQRVPHRAEQCLIGHTVWIFVLVLAAGLLDLVSPVTVWVATVLISVAVLLQAALGISRHYNILARTRPGHRGANRRD
jgi:Domain of unknown function (DUF1707)